MNPVAETGTVLDGIVRRTRVDLDARKADVPREELHRKSVSLPEPENFGNLLKGETVQIIAEFKRASPSKGRFPIEVEPAAVALDYVHGGAAAVSCLTDGPFFAGSLDDLAQVVGAVRSSGRPVGVLRKDFMIDPYQIDEARAYGASCILLIAACLDDDTLRGLQDYARSLGLGVLVEVHDERELDRALAAGAVLIGINNRDLKTLDVDLGVTARLAPSIPADVIVVGESGIRTAGDIQVMADAGIDAVLIGESLIVQPDRVSAVRELTGILTRKRS